MILRPVAPPVEYGITKRLARAGNAAIAFLRALGTSAHVWLPGANGTTVASLPSNNYLLSDGSTGYSTVDGVDGLTLDGMGELGSELVTNGTFDSDVVGWTAVAANFTYSAGRAILANTSASNAEAYQAITTVVGKTYKVSAYMELGVNAIVPRIAAMTTYGGGVLALVEALAGAGVYNFYFVATTTTTYIGLFTNSTNATTTDYYDNISCKEYTGTHLTQATSANKPLVRRGMLNKLLNSATPATQSVTCIAAPYTLALYGTGNVVLSGTGAGTLTGTGASDLVVLNFTPTAGSVTFTKAGTVSSFGLFTGTWTAAQILAEGGIPTTTATAASNPTGGKYWWSFDGSNDSLALGSVPFQMADDFAIIVGFMSNSANGALMSIGSNVSDTQLITLDVSSGSHRVFLRDDAAVAVNLMSAYTTGTVAVQSARKVGNTKVLRANGTQLATSSTAQGAMTLTTSKVGVQTRIADANYLSGSISIVIVVKGTLTDAELLLLERFAASVTPGAPVF